VLEKTQFAKFITIYSNTTKAPLWNLFELPQMLNSKNAVSILKGGLVSNNASSFPYLTKILKHIEATLLPADVGQSELFFDSLLRPEKLLTKEKSKTLRLNPLYQMRVYSALIKLFDSPQNQN
jgi:hypothetical protein